MLHPKHLKSCKPILIIAYQLRGAKANEVVMAHPTEVEFDPVKLIRMMANNGHNALIGAHVITTHGEGWCELAIPYDERLVQATPSSGNHGIRADI